MEKLENEVLLSRRAALGAFATVALGTAGLLVGCGSDKATVTEDTGDGDKKEEPKKEEQPTTDLAVGTALLAIAAKPNRHANGHNQQHERRYCQPGKRKHHANAHSNNRKQQQAAAASTRTINGRLSASPHRHTNLNIFEPYNAIACWTGTILSSSGSMRLFSASRSNAIWARSQ